MTELDLSKREEFFYFLQNIVPLFEPIMNSKPMFNWFIMWITNGEKESLTLNELSKICMGYDMEQLKKLKVYLQGFKINEEEVIIK
jgi:hypothetical protein